MSALIRALRAERLKLRHTLALWLCLLAPVLTTAFSLSIVLLEPLMLTQLPDPAARWQQWIDNHMTLWCGFLFHDDSSIAIRWTTPRFDTAGLSIT